MANNPQTTSGIILAEQLAPVIKKQIEKEAPTLAALLPTAELSYGDTYSWTIQGDGALFESVAEGSSPSSFGLPEQVKASVSMKNHWSPFSVTAEAITNAYHSGSPVDNKMLLAKAKYDATTELVKGLEKQLHAVSTATNKMSCFREMIGTGSYANVDGSSKTYWKSTVVDVNGSNSLDGYISKAFSKVRKASNAKQLRAFTNHAILENMISSFKSGRNFQQSVFDSGKVTFGETTFPAVYYNGVEIIAVPDGYHNETTNVGDIVFFDPSEVQLIYMPYIGAEQGTSVQTGFLGVDYLQLGAAGNLVQGLVRNRLQIVLKKRCAAGILTNVPGLNGYFS